MACEFSGIVRNAFRAAGHDAWSCDLLPTESFGNHIRGDVLDILDAGWDLMVAHPPCTHLSVSGARWFTEGKKPWSLQEEALDFVRALLGAPIPRIALENPVGVISTKIRKPDQYVQPWQFGDDASKKTGFWLKGLPLLKETCVIEPRIVISGGKEVKRWSNQTDSGQNVLGPTPDRGKIRSQFYPGMAKAMAEQWG